jgi:hypothetical protein
MGGIRNEYKMLVGNPGASKPLGRPRHRRDNNIRKDLKEM